LLDGLPDFWAVAGARPGEIPVQKALREKMRRKAKFLKK